MNRMAFLGVMSAVIAAAAIRELDNPGLDILDQPVRKTPAKPRPIVIDRVREKPAKKSNSLKRLLKQKVRK